MHVTPPSPNFSSADLSDPPAIVRQVDREVLEIHDAAQEIAQEAVLRVIERDEEAKLKREREELRERMRRRERSRGQRG